MKTIEQLIIENNINAEAALGRTQTSSGDKGTPVFRSDSNPLGLTKEQLDLLNKVVVKPKISLPPVRV